MLLLKRDFGGLLIIFIMPLLLIVIITMIQDSSFKNIEGTQIPIIFIDNDQGEISERIIQEIKSQTSFKLIEDYTEEEAKDAVFNGQYQMAIVIPENLTVQLNQSVNNQVAKIISTFGIENDTINDTPLMASKDIHLYFDPAGNPGFRTSVKNTISKLVFEIENKKIYSSFQENLGTEIEMDATKNLINYKEITKEELSALPNSVQHNVPAWTLFAIFFIIVPLSINLVKEKTNGTAIRLQISPTPFYLHLIGKTITFLIICILQFLMMVLVGIYLFPFMDLPQLEIGGRLWEMLLVTFFSGLAAIGLGILIGTLANTQEQSAPFGATSVVIMAAIGGVWVPVFLMPAFMQRIARLSPMNWGLEAYYSVLLRQESIISILPNLLYLLLFYIITVAIAIFYNNKRNAV